MAKGIGQINVKELKTANTIVKTYIKCGLIAATLFALFAGGCKFGAQYGPPDTPDANTDATAANSAPDSVPQVEASAAEEIVRRTTADFAKAIETADFTEMHSHASKDLQSTFTPAELKDEFKSSLHKKEVVLPMLDNIGSTPVEFAAPPSIRLQRGLKVMSAKGSFPTTPYPVRFEYEYVMRGGEWKLLTFRINIG